MNSPALDLSQAFRIAVEVHGSQRDLQGEPYLFHVMRVAMAMETDEERVVAILHDAYEDANGGTDVLDQAYSEYGDTVVDAVRALSRGDGERYDDYIKRLATNPLAVKVKLADIKDNCDPKRLLRLPMAEQVRFLGKYKEALSFLQPTAASSPHPAPDAQS